MKKLPALLFLIFSSSFFVSVNAKTVSSQRAATVAGNFYNQNFSTDASLLNLIYTEFSKDGQPVYYVFNVNTKEGFVIVSAEDAAHPILGYSDKGQYVVPSDNNNVGWWMNCRKQEIEAARKKNAVAAADIADEWSAYINNTSVKKHASMSAVLPLLQSTWNQSPYYNDMCPGGSVTGCVATCMAQIMRYWSYPAHGRGYSGYWELSSDGFWSNFGYLAANYDTSNYVWSAMPYNLTGPNSEVAKLMYDCGVSVCMNYSPYESGAWVIDGDYPVCSQNSYVKYFGYAKTVQGVYRSNYTLTNWITLIENELNNNRPVQYVGNDSVNNAGHTWVCDGYDVNNNFHMNWGWGGSSNGYFAPNAIMVSGYNFDWWDEAVIGIQPAPVAAYFGAYPTFGCGNLTVNFKDSSIANTAITAYNWIFPGGSPATSSAANPTITYSNPGTYDVTEIVTDANGTDTVIRKAYISVATASSVTVQDFQSATFPPTGWVINNPNNFSYTWQLSTSVGGYGASTQCMYFNNTQAIADYNTIYTGLWITPPGKPAVDIIGQQQQIYSPEFNFTNVTKPEIYFDVAYAPYSNNFSDTLQIYYSTDCGATFHMIYQKGGMTLATAGGLMVSNGADTNANGIFVPASNNWRTDTIHIPGIAGAANVMFSFENLSGNGAAMYIDNINLPGVATAIPSVNTLPSVKVYPNPNNGLFIIGLSNLSGDSYVKIYNVLGQEVYTAKLKNGNTSINLSSQSKGVYIYRVLSETGSAIYTGRLVVE